MTSSYGGLHVDSTVYMRCSQSSVPLLITCRYIMLGKAVRALAQLTKQIIQHDVLEKHS